MYTIPSVITLTDSISEAWKSDTKYVYVYSLYVSEDSSINLDFDGLSSGEWRSRRKKSTQVKRAKNAMTGLLMSPDHQLGYQILNSLKYLKSDNHSRNKLHYDRRTRSTNSAPSISTSNRMCRFCNNMRQVIETFL